MARTPFDFHNYSFSERCHRLACQTFYPALADALAKHNGFAVEHAEWESFGFRDPRDTEDGIDRILHIWMKEGVERHYGVQERFRRASYARYRELTVTGSNTMTGTPADYEKLKADLYVYGYVEDGFDGWIEAVVADVGRMKKLHASGCIMPNQSFYRRKGQTILGFPFDKLDQGGAIILHQRRCGKIVTF